MIINDDNWMAAMKNKTWEQNRVTTPLRKLITKLPGKSSSSCFVLNALAAPLFLENAYKHT